MQEHEHSPIPAELTPLPASLAGRSLVLVGLMGAGKTALGRRLALRLGLPFCDADAEIEASAGYSVAEIFSRLGEPAFREGERRVIKRLLEGPPVVLATGGGAFMDAETRAAIKAEGRSVWLRASLDTLVRRTAGRGHRPLLASGNPAETLAKLMAVREPVYAEADIVVQCGDDQPEVTTAHVLQAVERFGVMEKVRVALSTHAYDVHIGEGVITRAGELLAPILPQKRCIVVTDDAVDKLHLPRLAASFRAETINFETIVVPAGEKSKSLRQYAELVEKILALKPERRTTIVALGGGVIGDLAGFAASSVLRGLPFVQIPTTLLSQVDSSVGGKTGINSQYGKNLIGAFHQPVAVLADTAALSTLPLRELQAGYAEIVKAGLIADAALFDWCEANGAALLAGDRALQAEAVRRAVAFKAAVVADDEREEKPENGRALLNLGHSFGHALEAEYGYDGTVLHGEAVAIGLGLAYKLSARLGYCEVQDGDRVIAHLHNIGMWAELADLGYRFSASTLIGHMQRDKKMRDGKLSFVLARGIGQAFTSRDVPPDQVTAMLLAAGCRT
jgi:shikimate kinase/3-dehydroquinate synthase